ncbi:hypothetical protein [Simplicispira psychrophila]|uniref:hypothetical protein n=1 Tax=Simplicispira psychrophila TaxID=80882 RepID=UPI000AA3A45E|nr:hypothetical protein [Simplicispira psychrophila]
MTQRRRFFAATPVQTVPGQTVAVEVQMRRNALAPVSAPVSVPTTATWLLPQAFAFIPLEEVDWALEPSQEGLPFYDFWLYHYEKNFGLSARWKGTPGTTNASGNPLPIPGADFVCHEVTASTYENRLRGSGAVFFGVLQGATLADVHWKLMWNTPWAGPDLTEHGLDSVEYELDFDPEDARYAVSLHGSRASTWGNMVMVILHPTGSGGMRVDMTLTATAYSAGVEVAKLSFVAQKDAF